MHFHGAPNRYVPNATRTETKSAEVVEAIGRHQYNKFERQDARFENVNWATSQFNESATISWFWQSSLTNHSKSKQKEHKCRDIKKW
ncbi:hypothetical protein CR513_01052, partial [Mucuna pruriens]